MKKYIFVALSAVLILGVAAIVVLSLVPNLGGSKSAVHALSEPVVQETAVVEATPEYAVVAEAVVLPARHATLSMAASGIVAELLVQEGAGVEAGQVIVRLQNAHQLAAVAQAQAGLDSAQAQLDALEAGPRVQEIAAAQASLDAARARLARLQEGARVEEIAAAEAGLEAAKATLQRLYDGPDEHTRIAVEADLANAEAAVRQAQAAYDLVAGRSDIMMLPQSLQLEQATNAHEAAKARYEALFDEPDADMVAGAQAQVKQAQANLERLRQPVTENELAEAEAMVRQAQAQVDLLLAGARDQEIAAALAGVAQAEAALQQAQASLDDTELVAPFAGTIAALNVKEGEQVGAGMPVLQLADLATWQIETDDLTELDIVGIQAGARAILTFDAIPDLELAGTVERVKPLGVEKNGDVTYTVVVRPDEQDARLRWNMTAVVTIP